MDRYRQEWANSHYVIRDTFSGDLVPHLVLDGPERFRSLRRVQRRMADLEGRRPYAAAIQSMPNVVEVVTTWLSDSGLFERQSDTQPAT